MTFISEEEVITGNDVIFNIYFLSYLPTLLHSPGVPLNKELIWPGLNYIESGSQGGTVSGQPGNKKGTPPAVAQLARAEKGAQAPC